MKLGMLLPNISCMFAIMAFLQNLKFFPMEQSVFRIIYRFSWAIQIHCLKSHCEIRKTYEIFYRTLNYTKFYPVFVTSCSPILKRISNQVSSMKLCMQLPNNIPQDSFLRNADFFTCFS